MTLPELDVDPRLYNLLKHQQVLLHSDTVNDNVYGPDETRTKVDNLGAANLVSSERRYTGKHIVALDLDVPSYQVPSSTPRHSHLFIDVGLQWPDYERLLKLLGELGILEPGYVAVSIERKGTHLRLPWIKKEGEPQC